MDTWLAVWGRQRVEYRLELGIELVVERVVEKILYFEHICSIIWFAIGAFSSMNSQR